MFSGSGVIDSFLLSYYCIVSNAIRALLASLSITELHSCMLSIFESFVGPARYRISIYHEQIRGILRFKWAINVRQQVVPGTRITQILFNRNK